MRSTTVRSAVVSWVIGFVALTALPARADVTTLRIARQYGIGYLQMMVMEHDRLIEKHAKASGLPEVKVSWRTFSDGTVANDAMLSDNLDIAAGGLGSFVVNRHSFGCRSQENC